MKKRTIRVITVSALMVGLLLVTGTPVLAAPAQGDVAVMLADYLGLDASSPENAISALTGVGIIPGDGWNAGNDADDAFIGALYSAVNEAVKEGTIVIPPGLTSSASLVAAVLVEAGMVSTTVVDAIVAAGGNRDDASAGASFGAAAGAAARRNRNRGRHGPPPGVPPHHRPPGGHGGHGAASPSR